MAMDGMIGKKIKFEDWKGDTRTGEVVSILKNGDYEVSTDRGMALVKNAEIIKMRKGGYVPKSVQMKREKVAKVMHEFQEGKLHSGSKNGPIVKDRDQAIAIALAEANSKKMATGGGVNKVTYKTDNEIYANDIVKYADLQNIKASKRKVGNYYYVIADSAIETKESMTGKLKNLVASKMATGGEMGWKHKMAKGGNASRNYVVRYDPDGKKAMMNTLTEAKSFVKVLKSNGHSNIEILYPYNLKTVKMAKGGAAKKLGDNPFDLYENHPQYKEAEKAIRNGLKSGKITLKNLDLNPILEKYRSVGADDSEVRERIYLILKKEYTLKDGGGIHEADTIMYVELQSVGNVDFGDSSERHKNIPMKKVYVDSIEEAQDVVQQFIERHDLGSGNWTGGKVFKDGKNIGFIAYNGRFFEGTRPYANGGSTSDQYNVSIDWEQNKPKLKYGRKFFKNIYANSNEEAENIASEQWNSVKANSNKKVLSINSINMTELRKKPILDKPERKMTTGGGIEKTKMGKIKISDIEIGAKFKAKSGTVFIVDSVDGSMVHSSLEGGSKGNYRDPIGEFVAFMNEMGATKIMATGGSMYAGDGGVTVGGYEVSFFHTKANVYANIEIPSENPTFEDDIQVKGVGKTELEALEDLKKNFLNKNYAHGGSMYAEGGPLSKGDMYEGREVFSEIGSYSTEADAQAVKDSQNKFFQESGQPLEADVISYMKKFGDREVQIIKVVAFKKNKMATGGSMYVDGGAADRGGNNNKSYLSNPSFRSELKAFEENPEKVTTAIAIDNKKRNIVEIISYDKTSDKEAIKSLVTSMIYNGVPGKSYSSPKELLEAHRYIVLNSKNNFDEFMQMYTELENVLNSENYQKKSRIIELYEDRIWAKSELYSPSRTKYYDTFKKGLSIDEIERLNKSMYAGGGGSLDILNQRKELLQELLDSDIIDEDHGYYADVRDAIQSNDSEKMREMIDELLSSGFIYKDDWDYKLARKLSKTNKMSGGGSMYAEGGGVDMNKKILSYLKSMQTSEAKKILAKYDKIREEQGYSGQRPAIHVFTIDNILFDGKKYSARVESTYTYPNFVRIYGEMPTIWELDLRTEGHKDDIASFVFTKDKWNEVSKKLQSSMYAEGGGSMYAEGGGVDDDYQWVSFWWGGKSSRKLTKEEALSKGVELEGNSMMDNKKWWNYTWTNFENKGKLSKGGKLEDVVFVREKVYSFLNPMGYSARVEDWGNGVIHIEPSTTKVGNNRKDFFDGMQITRFDNGTYEVSEYQAGEKNNELYVYKETKSLITALKDLIKGNKRKPIKKYAKGGSADGVTEKITKARLKAKLYNPTGDFFIEDKSDKWFIHFTPKDADRNSQNLSDLNAESVGKGYYGSAYSVDKVITHSYSKGGSMGWKHKMAKGGLSNISFNRAELKKLSDDYYNVYLYKDNVVVYKGTLPSKQAVLFAEKTKNVKMIK